ncbi:MAG: glutamyl-tRNA reductase [Candidatus Omnitrophota bacterium]
MNIEVVGLNHRSAPIEIRETLAFSEQSLPDALLCFKKKFCIPEAIILSTCNRVEIYTRAVNQRNLKEKLIDFLSDYHRVDRNLFEKYLYDFTGINAIRHLFKVSSSLDSQVLGESQILGQIKNAYLKAKQAGTVSEEFSFIFEEAIKIGKQVRTQTQIGYGAISLSTAAVEMTRKIFEDLSEKKILIIGAGKISELTLTYLLNKGIKEIFVINRTYPKAQDLAKKLNAQALKFDKLLSMLCGVDIVISSINTTDFIVTKKMMQQVKKKRSNNALFFIDLGVPRNIDPQINSLSNIYVYNLDDLKRVKDSNLKERLKEAKKIEKLIEEQLKNLQNRFITNYD